MKVLAFETAGIELPLLQLSPQFEEMERFAEQVIPIVNGVQAKALASTTHDA